MAPGAGTGLIGPGRLVVVVGPSGAGKDTLIAGARLRLAGDPTIVFPLRIVTRTASAAEHHQIISDRDFATAAQPIVAGTHCVHHPFGSTGSLRITHLPSPWYSTHLEQMRPR